MKYSLSKVSIALGFIASAAVFNVAQAATLVGLQGGTKIGVFESSNAAAATFTGITGLADKEILLGIDLRPSNNTLYGISSLSNLYKIDAYTGQASIVAALTGYTVDKGLGYGIDFNPVADGSTVTPAPASLRVVSSAGDNLAVNANTGAVGNTANKIAEGYSGVAYSNSNPNAVATATQLYYLNSVTDTLHRADNNFNTPTISLVGALGIDILRANGFELFSDGSAFAAVDFDNGVGTTSQLLSINLLTGKASVLGEFSASLNGLAAAPSAVPVPAAAWLFGTALFGFAGFRRKSV